MSSMGATSASDATTPMTDTSNPAYYGSGAPETIGEAQHHTDNRFDALFEAGSNIEKNNQVDLQFKESEQAHALQREAMGFEQDKFVLGVGLQNRNIDLNQRTIDSQARATDVHSSALLSIENQINSLDASDPQYQRKLAALTNSFTAISQATAQVNSNITTQTAQGHGSLQTAQSGALGSTSTTSGQQIDAGVAVAGISADTQLGLADRKVVLDTTLAGTQADVAIHHTDAVGARVAHGQGNYYTGLGEGDAGFTSGSNANANLNSNFTGNGNFNYNGSLGGFATPFSGVFPSAVMPMSGMPMGATSGVLSGTITGLPR